MTKLRNAVMHEDILYRIIVTRHTSALVLQFHTPPGIFLPDLIFAELLAPCASAPVLILIGSLLIDTTLETAIMVPAFSLGILEPFVASAALRDSAQELLLKYT